jgi:hypothetical protein
LPDGDMVACIAYLIAGPLAITASMAAHERWMRKDGCTKNG